MQGFRAFVQELQGLGVRVLVTSRCALECGLKGAAQLRLECLTPDSAAELLHQQAGAHRATQAQAKKLAAICGHNALALTIVGGFIASQAITAEVGLVFGLAWTAALMYLRQSV